MGVRITVEAEVHPTEDAEKIKNAILLLFPDCAFEIKEGKIMGKCENIDNFATLLKEQRIRDAARAVFLSHMRDDEIEFCINKQVATRGKISFSVGDAPLGDIRVKVVAQNLLELIDQIAPDTRRTQSRS